VTPRATPRSTAKGLAGPDRLPRLSDRARHRWLNRCLSSFSTLAPCTQRFRRTRPAREFRGGLPGPARSCAPPCQSPQAFFFNYRLERVSLSPRKAAPRRVWLVRAGCLDCLTEPGIVGGIVACRPFPPSRPARNDSAVRGPRGSFEAACPDQPDPAHRPCQFLRCESLFLRQTQDDLKFFPGHRHNGQP
jgi:hypothetical protein